MTKGFTLLELILVIGILAILGAAAFNFYYGFQINIRVDEDANRIKNVLRQSQQKAKSGEEQASWGVRFVYPTSAADQYYDLFWGDSYAAGTTTDRYFLSVGVTFTNPAASSTLDVIFNKRSGESASSSVINIGIASKTSTSTKNISVTPKGLIQ